MFQSYLYGIEMQAQKACLHSFHVSIVPLWNWNNSSNSPKRSWSSCFNRTFMELKLRATSNTTMANKVSIVPLWNWNAFTFLIGELHRGFNRTFMELKCQNWLPRNNQTCSFNRTFMELKLSQSFYKFIKSVSFNRTFMELKLKIKPQRAAVLVVSIVPLWNWNSSLLR